MEQWLSDSAAQPRLSTALLGAFALLALLIASIGIYGVLAYSVSQRTHEIGLRLALGATPLGVLRMTLLEGMKVAVIGIGCQAGGSLCARASCIKPGFRSKRPRPADVPSRCDSADYGNCRSVCCPRAACVPSQRAGGASIPVRGIRRDLLCTLCLSWLDCVAGRDLYVVCVH